MVSSTKFLYQKLKYFVIEMIHIVGIFSAGGRRSVASKNFQHLNRIKLWLLSNKYLHFIAAMNFFNKVPFPKIQKSNKKTQ